MKQLSKQALETISETAQLAVPTKLAIQKEHRKRMSHLRCALACIHCKGIDKSKDKEAYIEEKIKSDKIFATVTSAYFKDGINLEANLLDDLLKKVSMIVSYMRYIGNTEALDSALAEYGLTIKAKDLSTHDENYADPEIQKQVAAIFKGSVEASKDILIANKHIQENLYNTLDENLRYDRQTNPSGLKAYEFDKLVGLELAKEQAQELAEKKMEQLDETLSNNIDASVNLKTMGTHIVLANEDTELT